MLLIKANPNHLGRFGHQFHNHLTGYLLARALRCNYLFGGFTGNADAWNEHVSYLRSKYTRSKLESDDMNIQKIHGAKGKEITKEMLASYYDMSNALDLGKNIIIELPFDQDPGVLTQFLDFYYKEIADVLGSTKVQGRRRSQIALHIRRGDVSRSKSSSLYMSDSAYVDICQQITSQYPSDWPITIYSEGGCGQFIDIKETLEVLTSRKVIINAPTTTFDTSPCDDFYSMAQSAVLVSSYSGYSYCAQLVSYSLGERYFLADKRSQMDTTNSAWLRCLSRIGCRVVAT